jgi:hypothetical protein
MNDEDLRDLFAGMALQGMLADNSSLLNINGDKHLATTAYSLADAMIEAKYADNVPEVGIAAVKKPRKTKEE